MIVDFDESHPRRPRSVPSPLGQEYPPFSLHYPDDMSLLSLSLLRTSRPFGPKTRVEMVNDRHTVTSSMS